MACLSEENLYQFCEIIFLSVFSILKVTSLMSSHPYNALWTQLGDLYGAVGFPTKLARTIVTATNVKKIDLLNKIINALTYFIRCGMVEKRSSCAIPIEQDDCCSLADNCSMSSLVSTTTLVDHLQDSCKTKPILLEETKNENVNHNFVYTKENTGTNNTNLEYKYKNRISSRNTLPQENITNEAAHKEVILICETGLKNHQPTEHSTRSINKTKSHSSLKESTLYPSLSNFKDDSVDSDKSFLNPEIISQKVSRLCRVTPNVLMYHSQKSESTIIENILPKKIDTERQLSSVDVTRKLPIQQLTSSDLKHLSSSISDSKQNISHNINLHHITANENVNSGEEQKSVVFVLGDNDELIGLKASNKLCDSKLSSAEFDSSLDVKGAQLDQPHNSQSVLCSSCILSKDNVFVHKQTSSYKDELNNCKNSICFINDKHRTQNICDHCGSSIVSIHNLSNKNSDNKSVVSKSVADLSTVNVNCNSDNSLCSSYQDPFLETERSGQKVVMVHSTVIELEEEIAGITNSLPPCSGKQVTRSQSLTLPSCNKPVTLRSQMCRHQHEYLKNNYHNLNDLNKVNTYLKHCDQNRTSFEHPSRGKRLENVEPVSAVQDIIDLNSSSHYTHCCEPNSKCRMNTDLQCSLCELCLKRCLESCSENGLYLPEYSDIKDFQNIEGNAMFDNYNSLSDEDTANNKHHENYEDKGKVYEDKSFVELPCPRVLDNSSGKLYSGLAASLLGGVNDFYIPDLILQACTQHYQNWENSLRRDLALTMRHSPLDQELVEAVCIVADADNWEVQMVSSHAYVVDQPGMLGVRVGMSQLVANMLESLLILWQLRFPAEECLIHIESKLRELCLRSQAVSNLLLSTDFCDIATLASTLDLEVNDIPLLLAVASTHTPEVTQRYGLSFI